MERAHSDRARSASSPFFIFSPVLDGQGSFFMGWPGRVNWAHRANTALSCALCDQLIPARPSHLRNLYTTKCCFTCSALNSLVLPVATTVLSPTFFRSLPHDGQGQVLAGIAESGSTARVHQAPSERTRCASTEPAQPAPPPNIPLHRPSLVFSSFLSSPRRSRPSSQGVAG